MHIPDLQAYDDMVTIEHCSVLQERLAQILDDAYPEENIAQIATDHLDPVRIRAELLELFTPKAFLTMFQTEMGKGVIIGAFIQKFIFDPTLEEDNEAS